MSQALFTIAPATSIASVGTKLNSRSSIPTRAGALPAQGAKKFGAVPAQRGMAAVAMSSNANHQFGMTSAPQGNNQSI